MTKPLRSVKLFFMIDLHLHTRLSYDSEETAENYLEAAAANGSGVLGFSEHYDYDVYLEDNSHKLCNIAAEGGIISSLRRKFPDIKILKGIELGYSREAVSHYRRLLAENEFDYAICSVHTVKGRGDCWFPEYFNGLKRDEAYRLYFAAVLESVRADLDFQIAAHIGYVARNAPYAERKIVYGEYSDIIDEILREIISRGVSLEINTSVDGSGAKFIPDTDVIDRYLELGGTNLTFGSDSHCAINYLRGAEEVRQYLLLRGVGELCYYENKQLKRYKI